MVGAIIAIVIVFVTATEAIVFIAWWFVIASIRIVVVHLIVVWIRFARMCRH